MKIFIEKVFLKYKKGVKGINRHRVNCPSTAIPHEPANWNNSKTKDFLRWQEK